MASKFKSLILPLTCTIILLAGCYEKVDWEFPHFDPKPVMNSILVAGNPVRVHVSLALPYLAEGSIIVEDAEVNLFVDGAFAETLEYQGKGYYQSQLVAEVGKEHVCEVHVDNYPVVRGSVTIPKPSKILDVEHINFAGVDEEGIAYPAVKVTFENNPDVFTCHEVVINTTQPSGQFGTRIVRARAIDYIDPVLLNEGLPITVFSNEIIEDDSYTMIINYTTGGSYCNETGAWYTPLYPLRIEFRTVSHCYYKYARQLHLYEYNNDDPYFSGGVLTPFTIYSNIENGYGIFTGYSSVTSSRITPEQ